MLTWREGVGIIGTAFTVTLFGTLVAVGKVSPVDASLGSVFIRGALVALLGQVTLLFVGYLLFRTVARRYRTWRRSEERSERPILSARGWATLVFVSATVAALITWLSLLEIPPELAFLVTEVITRTARFFVLVAVSILGGYRILRIFNQKTKSKESSPS